MQKELAILKKVRRTLSKPEHWAKGESAYLPDGTGTYPKNPEANSYCLTGAVYLNATSLIDANNVLGLLMRHIGVRVSHLGLRPVYEWNDHPLRTFEHVEHVLDSLIRKLEK